MRINKEQIATFLAILFHLSGAIGILCTPYRDWFIRYTPLNLLLMAVLLIWVQPEKNKAFAAFFGLAFFAGMITEMVGVNTGWLFGEYAYGTVLGPKWNGVPLLIGCNWFVILYCSGSLVKQFQEWLQQKYDPTGATLTTRINTFSLVVDGALVATLFDWVMEPAAIQLGFWHWQSTEIPFYNYVCWLVISTFLLFLFRTWPFGRLNFFAVHLLIIQALFFLALRIFL